MPECGVPECGVPECGCEASTMRRPWPTKGCRDVKQIYIYMYIRKTNEYSKKYFSLTVSIRYNIYTNISIVSAIHN